MAGIYLHIPFCKQACHYCNFHFSTSLRLKAPLVKALLYELELQADYLQGAPLQSIYFGGGTPSLLDAGELQAIFDKIYSLHQVQPDAEITLEANPDDLTADKIQALKDSPVNRLSIGVQSFSEDDLRYMNRAHNAGEARQCIELALAAGFDQLTVDLIYGSPTTSDETWQENMDILFDYAIPHLSAYCMTVEPQTALDHFVKKGKAQPVDDEQAARQFQMLLQSSSAAGYEQYEISNFARDKKYARHNSSYWLGEPYLGIGPAAHSFNGNSRQWNLASNARYIKLLDSETESIHALAGTLFEEELLTPAQRHNEYIMTGFRTIWGVEEARLHDDFKAVFLEGVQEFIEQAWVSKQKEAYILTDAGKLMADHIAASLFVEE